MVARLTLAVLLLVVCPASATDLFVRDAAIWTGDSERPAATWIAIDDGRIVALGDGDAWREHATETTDVIDARGGRVLPGLVDAHVHLYGAAMDLATLDLRAAASRETLLAMVKDAAAATAEGDWIVGARWSAESWPDQRPPTAAELDEASGGRPAVLMRMDGHSLLASSSALAAAGIDARRPGDPPGGTIGRDPTTGEPSGAVYEQAMSLVTRHIVAPAVDDQALLAKAVAEASRNGITTVGNLEGITETEAIATLDAAGGLSLRVATSLQNKSGDTLAAWRETLEWAAENPRPSEHVRVIGVKAYMDGTLGSRTAWMTRPYDDNDQAADKSVDNAGYPLAMASSGEMRKWIEAAATMGLQPAVHAIGDEANRTLLDWYAALPADVRERVRPRIEHAQHLRPQDVARFGELGVIPSMQPYHKADDGRYAEQRLGAERVESSYAFRGLLDSDATLAFGSDWPVVSVNPFLGIAAAVNAMTLDGEEFVPQQSISVEEAVVAYTRGAAYALHMEDEVGMLRPGMRADLIVLNRDVLDTPPAEIGRIGVAMTIFDGKVVSFARQN